MEKIEVTIINENKEAVEAIDRWETLGIGEEPKMEYDISTKNIIVDLTSVVVIEKVLLSFDGHEEMFTLFSLSSGDLFYTKINIEEFHERCEKAKAERRCN
jgi:hypothetical protein